MADENVPKIEILEKYESDTGVFVRVKTDYGIKTQLNFAKPITDEEIERSLRRFYEDNMPENRPVVAIKRGDKLDW